MGRRSVLSTAAIFRAVMALAAPVGAVMALAAPAAAAPCDGGMASVEYAVDFATGQRPAAYGPNCASQCYDECKGGVDTFVLCSACREDCMEEYAAYCDNRFDLCHDDCFPQPTFDEFADCVNGCLSSGGCETS